MILPEGPLPHLDLDPEAEVTPFALFRDLREGRAPLLVDVRPAGATGTTFVDAVAWPGEAWAPPPDRDVVLFDDDGALARRRAHLLRSAGHRRVRSLFGGLALWDLALDPEVVGAERYLTGR